MASVSDRQPHEHEAALAWPWRRSPRATSPTSGQPRASSRGGAPCSSAPLSSTTRDRSQGTQPAPFEQRLLDNLAAQVGGLTDAAPERVPSRLLVRATDPSRLDELCEIIASQPGVGYAAPVYITSRDQHDLNAAGLLAVRESPEASTFAVDARRSNTDSPGLQHGHEPRHRAAHRGRDRASA